MGIRPLWIEEGRTSLRYKITQGLVRCKLAIFNLNLQALMKLGGLGDYDYPYSSKRGLGGLKQANHPLYESFVD